MSRHLTAARRRSLAPAVVLAGVVAWLVFVALIVAQQPYGWAGIVSLVVLGASWFACRSLIGDIAERSVHEVDEYELTQRHAARNAGYLASLAALAALYVVATLAERMADHGRSGLLDQMPHLVFAALLLAAAAPSFLLAWRLRLRSSDPDEGEL